MPLRAGIEVINGTKVIRYNGNNSTGGRETGRAAGVPWVPYKTKTAKITAWRKRKAAEAEYRRRYLGG